MEIYEASLRLSSEVSDPNANEDYRERAPYLIAAICYRYASLDTSYRQANGKEAQKLLATNCFPLTTLFPLSDVFAPPVSMAVAGLLVLEENPKMSAQLMDLADEAISEIEKSIPYKKEKIRSHYTF
jgi:hypothetical protein